MGACMFSVIIPVYNCEKTIKQVLDSVRLQTRFDLVEEIIVLNDGSTDQTDKVIADYIFSNPAMPILYFRHKNHGVSYTRNRGIRAALQNHVHAPKNSGRKVEAGNSLLHSLL